MDRWWWVDTVALIVPFSLTSSESDDLSQRLFAFSPLLHYLVYKLRVRVYYSIVSYINNRTAARGNAFIRVKTREYEIVRS